MSSVKDEITPEGLAPHPVCLVSYKRGNSGGMSTQGACHMKGQVDIGRIRQKPRNIRGCQQTTRSQGNGLGPIRPQTLGRERSSDTLIPDFCPPEP